MNTIDNITFFVKFTINNLNYTARFALTLPSNKRPTLAHVSKYSNTIRGLTIEVAKSNSSNIYIYEISPASPTYDDGGLINLNSDFYYDDDYDEDYNYAKSYAKSLRFRFILNKDPHYDCYCKTRNVCGCGCDLDHNGS